MGGFRSQYHQPLGFNWSGVYIGIVSMPVNFFHLVGVSVSAELQDMAQNVIYSP